VSRNIPRRLMRLEEQVEAAQAITSHSMLIQFVDPQKGVTSTLLMEGGKQVWTYLKDEDASDHAEQNPHA